MQKCDKRRKIFPSGAAKALSIPRNACAQAMKYIVVLLGVFAALEAHAANLADTVERVSPSVVGVGTAFPPRRPIGDRPPRRMLGTGFVVRSKGKSFVITNAHVVALELEAGLGEHIAVYPGRGRDIDQRVAKIVEYDEIHDLAVLSYEGDVIAPVTLAPRGAARPGESVAFTGFPIGAVLGLYPTTHAGIISAVTPIVRSVDQSRELSALQLRRMRNVYNVYQLDAIAYPGNSGSAVYLAESGSVIGVMNSVFVKESKETLLSKPSGIAYAIPVAFVHDLLDAIP